MTRIKRIGSTKYKYVSEMEVGGKRCYHARISNSNILWGKYFDDLRDAAKAVDIKMIEKGKEPVNILVRK